MKTKTCSICKRELPVSKFWKNRHTKDGLSYTCIECYNSCYYSKERNTHHHQVARRKKKKHYTDWGGIILRDKSCRQCRKYRTSCPVNFDVITTDLGPTCKDFSG